ncbi:CHAD domain-containing protein [Spirillospora sp. CA-294931]|uniref:CYTH and CHAD domain-containing protein n=1 Tax=Spirillospora sp. CA-294931 TaxID=3240042 RepID=UPI003D90677F
MAEKHLEIELKFDAAAGFAVPELTGLPGVSGATEPETHELLASYFDTRDLRLAARGITLRRRRGGPDAGWHLKMPAGADSRTEMRAPLGRAQIVPSRLASLVAAHTRGEPLVPVATLDTERTVVRLLDGEGATLAEIADDLVTGRVLNEGDDASGTAWREIEVELGAGDPELLKAAGKRLRKAGASRASSASKLGRLMDGHIARPTPAEIGAAVRTRSGTAGDAVLAYLVAQVEAMLEYDPKARLAEDDAVHRMRVATRRIRSLLQSYAPVLDTKRTDPVKPELKWLAAALGEVRDLEVLRMRFTERLRVAGHEETPGWLDDIARRERGAYRRLNAALKEPRYYALLNDLEALIADPPLDARAARADVAELPRLVERAWKRMETAHAGIAGSDDAETARHDTRKAAKRARYAAEVASPVLGEPALQAAKNAKRIQEVLGGYQDGVIAMETLESAAARVRDTAEAFTLGVLYGIEQCESRAWLDRLEGTWAATPAPVFPKPVKEAKAAKGDRKQARK